MQIALFITCLTDSYLPRAGIAVVKVLEHLGHDVVFPREQTCCGQPMYNNGYHAQARDLARQLVRVFEPYETVVTPSGSCAAMIRDYYAGLFDPGSAERQAAQGLADKTYEFVELLTNVLKVDLRHLNVRWPGSATYHYSCHLRGIGITNEVEQLAEQIEDLKHRPLEKRDQCCGFGGTFALKYPAVSGSMVRDKVECIRATGARTVISNDAGCSMNIAGACRRHGAEVEVKSLAEIIAEGLDLLPREAAP